MARTTGRFRSPLHPAALAFSSSLAVDRRLYREDIEGSLAHVAMLAKRGILPRKEAAAIRRALLEVRAEIESGAFRLDGAKAGKDRFAAEDVHMAIERRVAQKAGPAGGRLHTARSRNDQVALDERLWLRRTIRSVVEGIRRLQRAFVASAGRHRGVIMPGYTHLQRAQPVLLAHHLLAYVSMLDRDAERFAGCLRRVNRSPLGAGALAGTPFPISRRAVADALGFDGLVENSIDAVSDRDSVIEFIACCATAMMHLSRFAEEMVLWSSEEWDFAEIGEEFTTGSSIMPQKRNPDMAELVRGKTGRVYGSLIAVLTVMKGLPLAYNRDMQEDKEPLFDSADTLAGSLEICALMLKSTRFRAGRFEEEGRSDLMLATELADYLAAKGMPFREAHGVVGAIVRDAVATGRALRSIPISEYRAWSPLFARDLYRRIEPRESIRRKRSAGSTSPAAVAGALRRWRKKLGT